MRSHFTLPKSPLLIFLVALPLLLPLSLRAEMLTHDAARSLVEAAASQVGLHPDDVASWQHPADSPSRASELEWLGPVLEARAREAIPDTGHPLIPFEVTPEIREFASRNAIGSTSSLKIQRLLQAIYAVGEFDDYYESHHTRTASRTLSERKGNCLSFTNLFIACARSLGLEAYYVNATNSNSQVSRESAGLVHSGHMVAEVYTSAGPTLVDFSTMSLERRHWYQPVSDVEAVALFVNNLGYEAMTNQVNPEPYYRMATLLAPQLPGPWNNLAVYLKRNQRVDEARVVLQNATRSRVHSFAPYFNLGLIYLQEGENEQARASFRKAWFRRPDNPYVVYHLGVTWLRDGKEQLAAFAFRRALHLDANMEKARGKLDYLRAQASRPATK